MSCDRFAPCASINGIVIINPNPTVRALSNVAIIKLTPYSVLLIRPVNENGFLNIINLFLLIILFS